MITIQQIEDMGGILSKYHETVINYFANKMTPITLVKYNETTNDDGDKIIESVEEVQIKGVLVQLDYMSITLNREGDFTGGFAELYVDLDWLEENNIEITPHNSYVKQDGQLLKILYFTEYKNKKMRIGMYRLQGVDKSIANI